MLKMFSSKTRLCEVCLQERPFTALRRVGQKTLCLSCLKLIQRYGDSVVAESASSPAVPSSLRTVLEKERTAFLTTVKKYVHGVRLSWFMGTATRTITYVALFFAVKPTSELYPTMQGAMGADLVTWLMVGFLELPFRGAYFAFEFLLYGGLVGGYLIQCDHALRFDYAGEQLALAVFGFLPIALGKIIWWDVRTFVTSDD